MSNAVAVAALMSLLLAACGGGSDDESVDSALAAAEAEVAALQAELDAVKVENEELSAALTVETDRAADEAIEEVVAEQEVPRFRVPNAVEVAERWGEAFEARDSDALRALYSSGSEIVDRNYQASWTDVDAAIERITNNRFEFTDVELTRVVEFDEVGPAFVAEYEATVFFAPEEEDGDRLSFVVVFNGFDDDALIMSQDIHFYAWRSFVTGEIGGYPQRTEENEGSWITVD